MNKILKPYTIIPNSLYVERDADRQLKSELDHMGRPAYVLVSRQMGKTNLLLYAKRQYANVNDIYVYIDLSNPFDTAKDCFQNIIDTIIDTNSLLTPDNIKEVFKVRENKFQLPPHKVHVNELRVILNSIQGKLVVILDEIDALTKTDYSDLIFSQIRSIYFSRANYDELNRLTYVLSGVVEPSEIIKDPKISPFNIGQKIFLNDFSIEELKVFIEKSKLELSNEIIDRIYYWTSGHPRITWDLCSEIENLKNTKSINFEDVDSIVHYLYLTAFDKPPIDNIRELVKKDKDIRNALIELSQGNNKSISDNVKSKLYLSGIVNYFEQNIKIKNTIIANSISQNWLKELEIEDKGTVDYAIDLYKKGFVKESLSNFEKYLETNDFPSDKKSLAYLYMGQAAYDLLDFEKAIDCLNKADFVPKDSRQVYLNHTVHLLKGRIYRNTSKIKESINEFEIVIKSETKDDIFLSALLSYGSLLAETNELVTAREIFTNLIGEEVYSNVYIDDGFKAQLKSQAYYNLAQIEEIEGHSAFAKKYFINSIDSSDNNSKPAKYIALYETSDNEIDKIQYLSSLVEVIVNEKLVPTKFRSDLLTYSIDDLYKALIYCYLHNRNDSFAILLSKLNEFEDAPYGQNIVKLFYFSINHKLDPLIVSIFLNDLYTNYDNIEYNLTDFQKLEIVKIFAYTNSSNIESNIESIETYIRLFKDSNSDSLDSIDFLLFMTHLTNLLNSLDYESLKNDIDLINSFKSKVSKENAPNYLMVQNLELQYYSYTGNNNKLLETAYNLLGNLERISLNNIDQSLITHNGIDIMKNNALSVIRPNNSVRKPDILTKIYGRNQIVKVKYKNGSIKEAKFKKIESDIINEKCIIIE